MTALLITPRWQESESWPGYLLRLAQENHLTNGITTIASFAGRTPFELLMSAPPEALRALGLRHPGVPGVDAPRPHWRINALFRAGRSRLTSFCPACAREGVSRGFHAALGDLPLQLICPKHACALARTCSACGDPISAFRRHVAQCDCGHPFALTRARPPSFPHQVIWKVLQVGRESPEAVSAFAAATARDIDAVCLIQYLAYAAGPGWLGTGRPKKPRIADAWVSEQQLESASAWFADWPASFETRYAGLMLDRRARGDRALPDVITLIRSFPALNSVIDDLIARRRQTPRPRTTHVPPREFMALKELMVATGLHYDTIRHWIDTGLLGNVQIRARGSHFNYKISRSLALSAVRFVKSTSSVSELARQVGLSTSALHTLVKAGYVDAAMVGKATHTARLKPEQIYSLTRDILARARGPLRRPVPTYSLSNAMVRAKRTGIQVPVSLITDIKAGVVEVHKTDASDRTLATVVLRREVLGQWLRSRHV